MDRADMRHLVGDCCDRISWRPWLLTEDMIRLGNALRHLINDDDLACDLLVTEFNKTRETTMKGLSEAQKKQAEGLGIDWRTIDWTKVVALIQLLLSIFTQPKTELRKGCPDALCNCCDCCIEAAALALESANVSLNCCADCCATPAK